MSSTNNCKSEPLLNYVPEHLDDEIFSLKKRTEELRNALSLLPDVSEDGGSECPYAKELYWRKIEAERATALALENLTRYVPIVKREVAEKNHNLEQIRQDKASLILEEAKTKYLEAQQAAEAQYKKACRQERELTSAIEQASSVLARSRSFKNPWPGEELKPSPGNSGGSTEPFSPNGTFERKFATHENRKWGGSTRGERHDSPANSELDDLMSLGPLKEDAK